MDLTRRKLLHLKTKHPPHAPQKPPHAAHTHFYVIFVCRYIYSAEKNNGTAL